MNPASLVKQLHDQHVELWLDGDKLRYRAPRGAISADLLTELKSRKSEVVDYLQTDPDLSAPISIGQRALWFLQRLNPQSCAYNMGFTVRIVSDVDVSSLHNAFQFLVNRHSSLRTEFVLNESQPARRIRGQMDVPFAAVDAADWTEERLQSQVQRDYRRPFGMDDGSPLLRVSLFSRATSDHVLLLTVHHAIFDGWSLWMLLDEFSDVYNALQAGREIQLAPIASTYADFVTAQREMVDSPRGEQLWAYWKQQLDNPPLLDLPTDRPPPQQRSTNGSTLLMDLPGNLCQQLHDLARAEDVTLYMLLLSAFQVLLHRYSRQSDLLVGAPLSGRTDERFSRTIGYFVNPVVMRSQLHRRMTFREFLQQTRRTVVDAITHQDYPFPLLVDKLGIQVDTSRTPLFQACFVFQQLHHSREILDRNASADGSRFTRWGNLKVVGYHFPQQEGQFDLLLEMADTGQSLHSQLKYNTDLFDQTTIQRMAGHLRNLLDQILANPGARVAELPLLDDEERQRIVYQWNDTRAEDPLDELLHQRFEKQSQESPDRIALTFENQSLTYRELNERANQLANFLRQQGVRAETPVGVCAERSIEMVVALYGILKAGGAYVPLDPDLPIDRLSNMVQDLDATIILTQQHLENRLADLDATLICLDSQWSQIGRLDPTDPPASTLPQNVAYVIYTSGSTGKPKGVMVSHRSICNRLIWMQDEYTLAPNDRILQKTPYSFDVSVWEFFWPLMYGAQLVVAKPGGHRDSGYLAEVINREQISTLHFVPSMLQAFLQDPAAEACPSLRRVICSGEALPLELQKQFYATIDAELHNLYGPTEAAVDVTHWACPRDGRRGAVPIGRPIRNTQIVILDDELQPVPVGIAGHLHIGGVNLARGYFNRPELTAERFVPDPFGEPGSRLYRTGDLAKYAADGAIEFLGRLDHQVKLRGFRIELGEIESVLDRHPSVRQSVVLMREDKPGRKQLVAYTALCNGHDSGQLFANRLREHLQQTLPDYMMPSAFVQLESLPLSPNGKVNRAALPAPEEDHKTTPVAPRNETEEILCRIFAETLNEDSVGIHDSFFALGGDSILCIQVVLRANSEGLRISVGQLYESQTVAALASLTESSSFAAVSQEHLVGPVPLMPIQSWFFEQDFIDPHHFNQSVLLRVCEDCDCDWLEQSLAALVHHHDALRLRFEATEGGWQADCAKPGGTICFSTVDLTQCSDDELATTIENRCAEAQSTLNLQRGPIFKAVYFDLGPARQGRLLLVVHHLAVDAVSWRILLDDLGSSYDQLQQGQEVSLPAKTSSYKVWADRLTQWADTESVQSQLGFWLAQTRNQDEGLPLDMSARECKPEDSVSTIAVSLAPEQTKALLKNVASAYRTQIDDVLFTALLKGFESWSGRRSLLVAVEGHGREELFDDVELTRTVGWFTTLYPLLLNLGSVTQPGDELMTIKEQLRAVPQRGIGYGALCYLSGESRPRSQLQELPEPEVRFNYLGQFHENFQGGLLLGRAAEECGASHSPGQHQPYLLDVNAFVADGCLSMRWSYSRLRYREQTVRSLAEGVIESLETLIAHCLSPEAGGSTPSDYPAARIGADQLAAVMNKLKQQQA